MLYMVLVVLLITMVIDDSVLSHRGSDNYGQTGHQHASHHDTLVPRKVDALAGKVVLSAQCGWLHTAFLVSSCGPESQPRDERDMRTSSEFGNHYHSLSLLQCNIVVAK